MHIYLLYIVVDFYLSSTRIPADDDDDDSWIRTKLLPLRLSILAHRLPLLLILWIVLV